MPNYALLIEYDGAPFVGWQRQAEGLSVQQVLEEAGKWVGEVVAPLSLPGFDNSAMDGYAVLAADVATATADNPVKLPVAEDIPAEALRSDDAKKTLPPLYGALLKNEQDMHLVEQVMFLSRRSRQG